MDFISDQEFLKLSSQLAENQNGIPKVLELHSKYLVGLGNTIRGLSDNFNKLQGNIQDLDTVTIVMQTNGRETERSMQRAAFYQDSYNFQQMLKKKIDDFAECLNNETVKKGWFGKAVKNLSTWIVIIFPIITVLMIILIFLGFNELKEIKDLIPIK